MILWLTSIFGAQNGKVVDYELRLVLFETDMKKKLNLTDDKTTPARGKYAFFSSQIVLLSLLH